MRPLIGITTASYRIDNKLYDRVYTKNTQAIAASGGLPVYLPAGLPDDMLRELYERVDAVLLPGGPDVDPALYGQERHPETRIIDDRRDQLELTIARWSVADNIPVFGICRGHQVLNVALGGTLIQDIPSQVTTDFAHDLPREDMPRTTRLHDVTIDASSRLATIIGSTRVSVNSLHHQSVGMAAPGALVTASAPDGVVEAIELPDKHFVLSVQWHPEDLAEGDEQMRRLFDAFVQAARERMHAKTALA